MIKFPAMAEEFQELAIRYQAIQQAERDAALDEVAIYRQEFVQLAAQYAEAAPATPKPWTIPRIFGRPWRENFISDYLAYLLNPNKSGLGEEPLAAFLALCNVETSEIDLADVSIYREYNLDGGRIDFLMEWEDQLVVGIEAKIGAAENPGQTKHYARVIKREFKDIPQHCVFLTRGGGEARSAQFQSLTWAQLLEAFRAIEIDEVEHPRQRVLWEDFLEHLEVFIVMNEADQFQFSEKAALYLEYGSIVEDIKKALNAEWADAITFLEDYLLANLNDGPWQTNFNKTRNHWHQIFRPGWVTEGLRVHYEYLLPPIFLAKGKFRFMIDVEGSRAKSFLAMFDQRYPNLLKAYQRNGISYRPHSRNIAIAHKTFETDKSIEAVAESFLAALEEFRFLEPEIEYVLTELEESSGDV